MTIKTLIATTALSAALAAPAATAQEREPENEFEAMMRTAATVFLGQEAQNSRYDDDRYDDDRYERGYRDGYDDRGAERGDDRRWNDDRRDRREDRGDRRWRDDARDDDRSDRRWDERGRSGIDRTQAEHIARENGMARIGEIERDDGGWEIEGRDRNGRELEIELGRDGQVLSLERD